MAHQQGNTGHIDVTGKEDNVNHSTLNIISTPSPAPGLSLKIYLLIYITL